MKNCCDLNLGESLCISTFFLFPDSRLNRLNGFYFLFWSISNGVTLKTSNFFCFVQLHEFPYGLAVRIPGFHPGGPGLTPGMGTHFLSVQNFEGVFLIFYQSLRLVVNVESIKVKCSFTTTLLRELLNALRLTFKRKYISNLLRIFSQPFVI